MPHNLEFYIFKGVSLLFLSFLGITVIRIYLLTYLIPRSTDLVLRHRIRLIHYLGIGLFLLILFQQAHWQLAGFLNPRFMECIRSYDKRIPNPMMTYEHGQIKDRNGNYLAENKVSSDYVTRYYPLGEATSHLLGYDHPKFGRTGIEAAREQYLAGRTFGSSAELLTVLRNLFNHKQLRGNELTISIDRSLQLKAYELIQSVKGAILLLNPKTGEILAMASSPGFNSNQLDSRVFTEQQPGAPLLNRCLNGYYPPGSTFKIILATLEIERGGAHTYKCTEQGFGESIGVKTIRDHDYYEALEKKQSWSGHGSIGLKRAFALSCNVYFAQLGQDLGAQSILEKSKLFGFESPLPLLPATHWDTALTVSPGKLPVIASDDATQLCLISIGQGILSLTPMHMALVASSIANSGQLIQPTLELHPTPKALSTPLSPENSKKVGQLMTEVVMRGTGSAAKSSVISIAGKTGTAENPDGPGHGWFVGYAPAENPKIAFAIIVENAGYASQKVVPLARRLMERAHELGYFSNPVATPGVTHGKKTP